MNGLFSCHATRIHGGGYVWICSKHVHLWSPHHFVPVPYSIWASWHQSEAHR